MAKKKIAVLTHGLSMNGIEALLMGIFRSMDLSDVDLDVIMALDPDMEPVHEKEANDLGIRTIHICDLGGIGRLLAYLSGLRKTLRTGCYDVVHVNMDMLGGLCLLIARLAGIRKRICHAHNTSNTSAKALSVKGIYYAVMRFLIRTNSTDFVGCSQLANEYFFGKKKATVIPNGINLERFSNPPSLVDPTSIGLEPGTRYLTTVGRITDQKNPLFMVEIMAALQKIRSDAKLVWVGSGAMEEETRALADKLGVTDKILFLGARTDVNAILPHCEIFLFPSKYEGFGIVLLEAQAAGLTCVASEEIPHDADAGGCVFVSLKENADAWAKVIDGILNSESRPLADPNRLLPFDIRQTAKSMKEIYMS